MDVITPIADVIESFTDITHHKYKYNLLNFQLNNSREISIDSKPPNHWVVMTILQYLELRQTVGGKQKY